MYDPTSGRWFEEDPIGFDAGDTNLYRFEGNSPTNWTDPSGLDIRNNQPDGTYRNAAYVIDRVDALPSPWTQPHQDAADLATRGAVGGADGAWLAGKLAEAEKPGFSSGKGEYEMPKGPPTLGWRPGETDGTPAGREAFWAGVEVIAGGAALKGAKGFWAFMTGGGRAAAGGALSQGGAARSPNGTPIIVGPGGGPAVTYTPPPLSGAGARPILPEPLPTLPAVPPVTLPVRPGQIQHIFRDAPGHLPDTAANRALLEGLANDSKAVLGPDKFGNTWAARINPDGTQTWVQHRNGVIINGGVNLTPRTYNPETGLSFPK